MNLLPRFLSLVLLAAAASAAPELPRRIPVILDTDIGTDIDDSWALAYLLRCPELDLKLVLTDTGDTRYRAKVAAKLLQLAGRSDVPVGIGRQGTMGAAERNLDPWARGYDLGKYPGGVREDGIGALIDTVMQSPEPVTIIAIGAVPNLADALSREPRIAAKCHFVGMQGSFDLGYGGSGPAAAATRFAVFFVFCRRLLTRSGMPSLSTWFASTEYRRARSSRVFFLSFVRHPSGSRPSTPNFRG